MQTNTETELKASESSRLTTILPLATEIASDRQAEPAPVKQDQLEGPSRICGCSCIPTCNCNCTCACIDHCVCRIEPCVGNCRARVSRNLVVSIDGTSKQFGVYNTNVVELHGHIDPKAEQHKYYHPGIGSYVPNEGQSAIGRAGQWIGTKIDLAIARNLRVNILEAYKWLSQIYHRGDKIFIFGFSRGAYQARALTAMIERVGLVDRGNESMIPYAYEIYLGRHKGKVMDSEDQKHLSDAQKKSEDHRSEDQKELGDQKKPDGPKVFLKWRNMAEVRSAWQTKGTKGKERKKAQRDVIANNFKSTFSRDVRIHFTGVWDTVSSVGLIYGNLLPLTSSAQHICIFRHALALDEQRVRFLPEYVAGSSQGSEIPSPNVKEVWFPGTHSDIGGGVKENQNLNLSSVPLLWMENEAVTAGLRLLPRKSGGEWETTDLRRNDIHASLKHCWSFLEYLPLKRLSFKTFGEHTRIPHCGAGRIIVPGQRIHISVAFKDKNEYIPRAQFRDPGEITWDSFLGQQIASSTFSWVDGLRDQVEKELFDPPFMLQAIKRLQELWTETSTVVDAAIETNLIQRLAFMALSGRLAPTYLSKLEEGAAKIPNLGNTSAEKASSKTNKGTGLEEINTMVTLFKKLQTHQRDTFDADLAALLEHKAGILVVHKEVPDAVNISLEAAAIRLEVAQRSGQGPPDATQTLNTCLEKLRNRTTEIKELSDDVLGNIQDAVKFQASSTQGNTTEPLANSLNCVGVLLRHLRYDEDAINAHKAASELRRSLASTDPAVLPVFAQSLHYVASELSYLNRQHDSLPYITEAVEIRRQLKKRDVTMTKDFARSLTGLAWDLQAVSKYTEAKAAVTEAVETFRQLSQTDPSSIKGLAAALYVFALVHRADNSEISLSARREVVELRKKVASMDPGTNELPVADALSYLAMELSDLGHPEEALNAGKAALAICRKLPDTFELKNEYVGMALHDLGAFYSKIECFEDAARTDEEAVNIRRLLVGTDFRDTSTRDLRDSLWNLAVDLYKLGRHDEALQLDEEIVAVSRKLPDRDLISALERRAQGLRDTEQHKDVVQVDQEIVEVFRRISNQNEFGRNLGMSLNNLAVDLCRLRRFEEAANADKEAAQIYRDLVKSDAGNIVGLERALRGLGFDLRRLSRYEEAVHVDKELVAVVRSQLALAADPTTTQSLASCLENLGLDLTELGQHEDALHVDQEVVEIRRKLAETDATMKRGLARSLMHASLDMRSLGQDVEALHAREEAVAILRELAKADTINTKDLVQSLRLLASGLHVVRRYEDVVQIRREQITIQQKLAETDPAMNNVLLGSLLLFAADLHRAGYLQEALHSNEDAVILCRKLVETGVSNFQRLAYCIHRVGVDLEILGRYEEAQHIHKQATEIIRTPPSPVNDASFTQLLVRCLMSEGYNLVVLNHPEEALQCLTEAVELSRGLPANDHPHILPRALACLGINLCALKNPDASIQTNQEAVELFEKRNELNPASGGRIELAAALKFLAVMERAAGSNATASIHEEKWAVIHSELIETDIIWTALALDEEALTLRVCEFREAALRSQRMAVELYRKITQTNVNCMDARIRSLGLFAKDLRAFGREEEAREIDSEIAELSAAASTAAASETPSVLAANQATNDDPKSNGELQTAASRPVSSPTVRIANTTTETPSAPTTNGAAADAMEALVKAATESSSSPAANEATSENPNSNIKANK